MEIVLCLIVAMLYVFAGIIVSFAVDCEFRFFWMVTWPILLFVLCIGWLIRGVYRGAKMIGEDIYYKLHK